MSESLSVVVGNRSSTGTKPYLVSAPISTPNAEVIRRNLLSNGVINTGYLVAVGEECLRQWDNLREPLKVVLPEGVTSASVLLDELSRGDYGIGACRVVEIGNGVGTWRVEFQNGAPVMAEEILEAADVPVAAQVKPAAVPVSVIEPFSEVLQLTTVCELSDAKAVRRHLSKKVRPERKAGYEFGVIETPSELISVHLKTSQIRWRRPRNGRVSEVGQENAVTSRSLPNSAAVARFVSKNVPKGKRIRGNILKILTPDQEITWDFGSCREVSRIPRVEKQENLFGAAPQKDIWLEDRAGRVPFSDWALVGSAKYGVMVDDEQNVYVRKDPDRR